MLKAIQAIAVLLGMSCDAAWAANVAPPPQYVTTPASSGAISAALEGLDSIVLDVMERTKIPGLAVGVVHQGQTVYAKGFGVRSVETGVPVNADTVFLLASLSKPLGATVVARQVSEGVVSWETAMAEIMPSFSLGQDWIDAHVSIGDLYAHRAGLPDHAGDDLEDVGFDRDTVIERLPLLPMGGFRLDYAYTNFGLTAAAEAVALAKGSDWASLSEMAIYRPLGMTSTSSRHADYMARSNRAASHIQTDAGFAVADLRQPDAQSPAGGASASVSDMARWMIMVLGEGRYDGMQLIAPQALLPAVTPQITSARARMLAARSDAYGYGFNVGIRPTGRVSLSHSGAFALGAATSFLMIPDLELGIVVLTNAPPIGVPEAIAATFADHAEFGQPSRDWLSGYSALLAPLIAPVGSTVGQAPVVNPTPPTELSAYTGTFENAYFGSLRIEEVSGSLSLIIGPNEMRYPLAHRNSDAFTIAPFTENQPRGSISVVTFSMTDEAPRSVHVEHLDEYGWGTFQAVGSSAQ